MKILSLNHSSTPYAASVLLLLGSLLWIPTTQAQDILQLTILGADEKQTQNILAHLGPIPDDESQISRFIGKARARGREALIALGYNNARIDLKVDRKVSPIKLTLNVTPGPPTKIAVMDLRLEGDGLQEPDFVAIIEEIRSFKGRRLDHGRYEKWKDRIESHARSHGYLDAKWVEHEFVVDRLRQEAKVILHFDSGMRYRLGDIAFNGSDISSSLLDGLTPVTVGDLYQSNQITQLESALRKSGYFDEVWVSPRFNDIKDQQIPLQVKLSDAPSHSFRVGLGFVTDTGPRASLTWRTPRVNRWGHSQESTIRYSPVNPYLSVLYKIPGDDPLNENYQIRLGLEENEFGDLTSQQQHLAVAKQTVKNRWVINYQIRYLKEDWRFDDGDFQADYLLPGVSVSRTRRQGPIRDPETGFRQTYLLEATDSALGSNSRLVRATASWRWLQRWDRHRLVLRAQAGINVIDGDEVDELAPSLRFFAGGDQSIRGFDYHSLGPTQLYEQDGQLLERVIGGKMLAVASAEYQYYVKPDWRVAFFTDGGNAFNGRDIHAVQSIGTGVHWLSPVGAIRVEVAYGISEENPPWRIHINMGAEL
ncbi:autotransporter assembly complex protein TamA [Aliiglaciecola sp. CAU 1673]|uniref:autotransporter assembly complex protein TamA n=1 Tax=Aliiglaciecola sp. CAU 1673 TaxID=3032595 RepID=UPI0023DB7971|nr:autotransporter assembly complex family protein [Aliiglaciecola sp. CAU 1673]MDF2179480.1 autotransporter assembly complex protein TamA [Aliiglaciecola sp. CAU 1673]